MEKFKEFIKNKVEAQEPVGEGAEKVIYPHPDKPEKVLGVFKPEGELHSERSLEFNKAKYYLGKIIHILLPKNIPDTSMVTTQPRTIVRDKINVKKNIFDRNQKPRREDIDVLSQKMNVFGLRYDGNAVNFLEDDDGNTVYIDELYPWFKSDPRNYNPDKIRESILENLVGPERESALIYLNRLEVLYKLSHTDTENK